MNFPAIAAALPHAQRVAFLALVDIEEKASIQQWVRTRLVSRRTGRRDTTAALRALEVRGLVRSEWGSAGLHWRLVRVVAKPSHVSKWLGFCGLEAAA